MKNRNTGHGLHSGPSFQIGDRGSESGRQKMRVTVVLPKRNTSPVASVNSNARPLRCREVAWPSPTKRSTWRITNVLSVAALRRDGGGGCDPTSEQPCVICRPRAPRSGRDTTDSGGG